VNGSALVQHLFEGELILILLLTK